METVEGLIPRPDFDPHVDPDGFSGRSRHELLPWIFDRHHELGREGAEARGIVEGGLIDFRLEYVGMSNRQALRRAAGAHHKLPRILARTLALEPHRLVYVLPCSVYFTAFEPGTDDRIPMRQIPPASDDRQLPRRLLISVAEEALIAWFKPPYNERNTQVGHSLPRSPPTTYEGAASLSP